MPMTAENDRVRLRAVLDPEIVEELLADPATVPPLRLAAASWLAAYQVARRLGASDRRGRQLGAEAWDAAAELSRPRQAPALGVAL